MSSTNPPKKKVVVTTKAPSSAHTGKTRKPDTGAQPAELVFGRMNYLLMAGGLLLIALGLALMAGGHMPDPDTWDESLIYSTRRTVVAPMVMLLGLGLEIYAIFKRS